MAKSRIVGQPIKPFELNRLHRLDSKPTEWIDLSFVNQKGISPRLSFLSEDALKDIIESNRSGKQLPISVFQRSGSINQKNFEMLTRCGLHTERTSFLISRIYPKEYRIMSDRQYQLNIEFAKCYNVRPIIASVIVKWAGKPFVVEQKIHNKDLQNGFVAVKFSRAQALPPGPAVFLVNLFDDMGGQSHFRTTCMVLPSNPLSLNISPRVNFVTGSFSARGVRESGNVFRTRILLTISNGDNNTVRINRSMPWKFWDGGVGGTLVESATFNWASALSIPAHSTWSGLLTFTSPAGSGIFNRYDDKEDMTIEIKFTTTDGRSIVDTITARVMVGFGMNITRVGKESFTNREYDDLYNAVDVTQEIYEARDVSYTGISRRFISNANAGGYTTINSESEARDLFGDWSGPDNDFIDVFIVHDHTTPNDGMAGDIPGPTSHNGRDSGVWADKTGYVDADGNKRLRVNYLGMLIGHEVGHYLGLSHVSIAGNLMLSSSGTNDTDLNYDQYDIITDYAWVLIL